MILKYFIDNPNLCIDLNHIQVTLKNKLATISGRATLQVLILCACVLYTQCSYNIIFHFLFSKHRHLLCCGTIRPMYTWSTYCMYRGIKLLQKPKKFSVKQLNSEYIQYILCARVLYQVCVAVIRSIIITEHTIPV